eukprot:301619-Alexandrium_andersonii.AAC.1
MQGDEAPGAGAERPSLAERLGRGQSALGDGHADSDAIPSAIAVAPAIGNAKAGVAGHILEGARGLAGPARLH